jgi:undecaprenyl-diphosphatase
MNAVSGFEAALWGILQGLTEFLPVSSSGHLVLVPWLLRRDAPGFSFDVLVHLATLLAVLVYFRAEFLMLIRGVIHLVARRRVDTPEARLAWLVIISSIPAILVALVFQSYIEQVFGSPLLVAVALLVTGTILYLAERRTGTRAVDDLTPRDAGLIGLAQAVALIPGISRSGATMAAGMGRDLARPEAARYAFVMSIPVIFGAAAKELLDLVGGPGIAPGPLAIGMLAAFVSGYIAITLLFRHVQRHSLRVFSVYCWALGMLSLVVYLVRAA